MWHSLAEVPFPAFCPPKDTLDDLSRDEDPGEAVITQIYIANSVQCESCLGIKVCGLA